MRHGRLASRAKSQFHNFIWSSDGQQQRGPDVDTHRSGPPFSSFICRDVYCDERGSCCCIFFLLLLLPYFYDSLHVINAVDTMDSTRIVSNNPNWSRARAGRNTSVSRSRLSTHTHTLQVELVSSLKTCQSFTATGGILGNKSRERLQFNIDRWETVHLPTQLPRFDCLLWDFGGFYTDSSVTVSFLVFR